MMGFMEANNGRAAAGLWLEERRHRAAVACFVRYFGPKAANPVEYIERDWMAEEFEPGVSTAPTSRPGYGAISGRR